MQEESMIVYPAYWKDEYEKQMVKGKWLPLPFQCKNTKYLKKN